MKNFLLSAVFAALGISAIAQIDNGDFEAWNKLILFEHPVTGITTMSSNYETFFESAELNVNEIEGPTGQALRIENINTDDEVMPGYFLFGETPNSNEDGLLFDGGFAVSDGNVTGISMDLNYDFPSEATGFVIVQFKSNNEPIGPGNMSTGTFLFPLSGSQSWSNVSFDFGGALGVTPDQCVVGIASADLIGDDAPFQNGAFVEVDNIVLTNSSDQVPGGNFESWSFVEPIFYPENCTVDVDPFDANYQRTDAAFEGTYALMLLSTENEGEVEVGQAIMGNREDDEILPTIEITEETTSLSFMYVYSGANDMGEANIIFYEESMDGFMPVYQKAFDLEVTEGYEMMEYNFADELMENGIEASHMAIVFSSSKQSNNPQAGSILIVDNVEFGSALGIFSSFTRIPQMTINAYPNPTLGRVVFDFGVPRSGYYRVLDRSGNQIAIVEFSGTKTVIHNLMGLAAGKYFFKFSHNGGTESVRVIKI